MNAFMNVVWYMYAYRHAYIHQTIALSEFRERLSWSGSFFQTLSLKDRFGSGRIQIERPSTLNLMHTALSPKP